MTALTWRGLFNWFGKVDPSTTGLPTLSGFLTPSSPGPVSAPVVLAETICRAPHPVELKGTLTSDFTASPFGPWRCLPAEPAKSRDDGDD